MFSFFSVRTFRFYLMSRIIADFVFFRILATIPVELNSLNVCAFFYSLNLLLLNVCAPLIERHGVCERERARGFRFLVVQIRIYYRASTNGFSCTPAICLSLCHTRLKLRELKTNKKDRSRNRNKSLQ